MLKDFERFDDAPVEILNNEVDLGRCVVEVVEKFLKLADLDDRRLSCCSEVIDVGARNGAVDRHSEVGPGAFEVILELAI